MDWKGWFDAFAPRSLAVAKTRRGLLGTLAALGAGFLGARATDAQQVTQAYCGNVVCCGDGCACKPGCVCCVHGNGNSRCRPPGSCSGGTEVVFPALGLSFDCETISGEGFTSNSTVRLTVEQRIFVAWIEIPNVDGVFDPAPTDMRGAFTRNLNGASWCTSGEYFIKAESQETAAAPAQVREEFFFMA